MGTVKATTTHEEIRQLSAAAEGRFRQSDTGRYVIDGEARPERKVRESLIRRGFLTWLFSQRGYSTVGLKITPEGEAALRVLRATEDDHA